LSRHSLSFCALLCFSLCRPLAGDDAAILRKIHANLSANDSNLRTLVAEYDVTDRILGPSIDRSKPSDNGSLEQRVTESAVRVWLRHTDGLIRVEYEEKAGTRKRDEAGGELLKQYRKEEHRYLKTPEHFIRFPVSERRIRVSGFPDVPGFGPGKRGRVLYRDESGESKRYEKRSRFFDPRLVFSNGSLQYQKFCSLYADALDGLRTEPEQRHASSNLTINLREDGCNAVGVKYGGGAFDTEAVFDPAVGNQAVSFLLRKNGNLKEKITTVYELKNGVYVPSDIEMKFYRGDSKGYTERHFRAIKLDVNAKIADETFALSNLGLEYGDRMADSVTGSLQVWNEDGFVDHTQFKMDPSRMRWLKN